MADVPISALPNAATLTGSEFVPMVQGGVTVKALSAALVGAAGPPGPTGPAGPTGPTGATGPAGGQNLNVNYLPAGPTYSVAPTDDVIVLNANASQQAILLPTSTAPAKPIWITAGNTFLGNATVATQGADVFVNGNALLTLSIGGATNGTVALYPYPAANTWLVLGAWGTVM
jgi:hypothetical protein